MVDGETYGCVKRFCLDGDGVADLADPAKIRNGWMMFRDHFPFLTFRAPPPGDERSSVCQLCQKQHDLWKSD